jgi:hypothetical protein
MTVTRSALSLYSGVRRSIALGSLVLLLLCHAASAQWAVQRLRDPTTKAEVCHLVSETVTMSDGYDTTRVTVTVTDKAIVVQTESPLDVSFHDIGMQVDRHAFVSMDNIQERKTAVFATGYTTLVEQSKKGVRLRVQLRFWPTWPATGTHDATFPLKGFTKAYAEMLACQGG